MPSTGATLGIVSPAAPSPPAAASTSRRYNELEAYRGIAAVAVIVYHCYQHAGPAGNALYAGTPFVGVVANLIGALSLFFVLSGFIIFLPFAQAALDGRTSYSPRGFLTRRAIRILPLYYLAIVTVWASRYAGQKDEWMDLVRHLTFTQIFSTKYIFWTIGPAWTLAVEFWFYLLTCALGVTLFPLCRRLKRRESRVALLAGICLALIAISV
ncbi:MAG TPA: acyltransferase family protein, partial [Chloroflexota bacterium]|nr:acyltransferase family protein [Chloroflexota bacterium]